MKFRRPAIILGAALTIGATMPSVHAMGVMAAAPAGGIHAATGFQGHGFGFHGSGFPHRFVSHAHLFHQPNLNFGAGFASHRSNEVFGGYGDNSESYADDDISNLHFRVQEPFGPGDIGRRPVRDEGSPYDSGRMPEGPMQGWREPEPQD